MTERPWLKFYPRDWRGDQALRAVSIAARGLWMECLCIMHEAKPYGHLTLNGDPVGGDVLARMTGVPVDEVSALMAELRQAGVLSVTSRGVVFSRRMTKDHARARKGQKAVSLRWSQVPDGVEQSGAPNRSPNRSPNTQKPEARSQIPEDTPLNTENNQNTVGLAPDGVLNVIAFDGEARNGRYPPAFEELWREYGPISQPSASKAKAFQAWRKLTPQERLQCWDGLISYVLWVREQRRTRTDFPAKHLATFVNGRGWEPFIEQQQEVAGWTPH